jgi:protein TonB
MDDVMYASPQNRTASALASAAIVAGIGAMLLSGLQAGHIAAAAQSLVAIDLAPPPPRPTPTPTPSPRKSQEAAPKGDPGTRNLKNKATQIVAVKPPILIVPPPPVAVATTPANIGNATQSGASDRPGPGQGAGDFGNGLGGGGTGGNGFGGERPPIPIRDKLAYRYIPDDVGEPGETVSVGVDYIVQPDGHVTNCRIIKPSRYPRFDDYACGLMEQRFLFKPARDRSGRPVPIHVSQHHYWEIPRDRDDR